MPTNRVKRSEVLFALRETAKDLLEVRLWIILAAVVGLVALAGPFYTIERLGLIPRLIYWGTVGVASALLLWLLNRVLAALVPRHWPGPVIGALAGALGVLPVMGLTTLGSIAVGMALPQAGFWGFFPYVAPTVIGISMLVHTLVSRDRGTPPAPPPAREQGLFSRLPPGLGQDIIAVQAQDHYVHVATPEGGTMILMRMGDATQDLHHLPGMQIHRSWWVNLDHVRHCDRTDSGGIRLVLSNGTSVPVPRARQTAVRRAVDDHRLRLG